MARGPFERPSVPRIHSHVPRRIDSHVPHTVFIRDDQQCCGRPAMIPVVLPRLRGCPAPQCSPVVLPHTGAALVKIVRQRIFVCRTPVMWWDQRIPGGIRTVMWDQRILEPRIATQEELLPPAPGMLRGLNIRGGGGRNVC